MSLKSRLAAEGKPRRSLYKSYTLACERCGQEHVVERGGHFRDADYYELFQEHIALQHQFTTALKFLHLVARTKNAVK